MQRIRRERASYDSEVRPNYRGAMARRTETRRACCVPRAPRAGDVALPFEDECKYVRERMPTMTRSGIFFMRSSWQAIPTRLIRKCRARRRSLIGFEPIRRLTSQKKMVALWALTF